MEQQQEQQGPGQQSSLYPPCNFPLLGHSFPVAPFSLMGKFKGFSSSLFFFIFSEREGGKGWQGDVWRKSPVPFPASLPAGCSSEPAARLVAVPERGEGGVVPDTPWQAELSSPRRSAPHGGKKKYLPPFRRTARPACLSLRRPQTRRRYHSRDSMRKSGFVLLAPQTPRSLGGGATGGGGPALADMIYGGR